MKRLLLLTSSLHVDTTGIDSETTGVLGTGFTYDFTPVRF